MESSSVDLLCHGLLREYLARQGFTKTLNAFDYESPRDESSITNRKILAQSLHIGKLVAKNKEKGEMYKTFLEMIVDNLVSRYVQVDAGKEHTSKSIQSTPAPAAAQERPISRKHNISTMNMDLTVSSLDDEPSERKGTRSARPASPDVSSKGRPSSLKNTEEVSSPSLKRVGFAIDKPKLTSSLNLGRSDSPDLSSLKISDKKVGISPDSAKSLRSGLSSSLGDAEDIVFRHARMHSGKNKLDLNGSGTFSNSNGNGNGLKHEEDEAAEIVPAHNSEPIETFAAIHDLDKLVFGPTWKGPKMFQEEWHQGFFFSDNPELRYGLVQLAGGSCGVLAVVQAFVLKELVFSQSFQKHGFNPSDNVRTTALVHSLAEILWQVGGSKSAKLVLPASIPKRFKPYKLADWSVSTFSSVSDLQSSIRANLGAFTERNGCGVLLLMYSAVLTRGVANVRSDMDVAETSLMAPHKYCSQELVNLLLVGRAVSNVFDGIMDMEGTTLKGISNRSNVGFLTIMEKYGYCQVGNNVKNPVYPIWILYSESHYSLLFATQPPAAPDFDLYYYDQLGNQDEQYRITVDITSSEKTEFAEEEDLVSPIEMCILTKWPNALCNWNGSDPLL